MLPYCRPADAAGDTKVFLLASVTGLTEWKDYIPVQETALVATEINRVSATGFQQCNSLASDTGLVAFKDYIPVFVTTGRTKPWTTDPTDGYIPVYLATGSFGTPDPEFGNVTLLSHFNGTDEGQDAVDETGNHTFIWTPGGGLLEADSAVFGSAALQFDTKQAYIHMNTTAGLAFGTGDFTIELIFTIDLSDVNASIIYDQRTGLGAQLVPTIYSINGSITYHRNAVDLIVAPGAAVTGGTYRVAVSRTSGETSLYIDGTRIGLPIADTTNYVAGATLWLGTAGDGTKPNAFGLVGAIDELRVTKGVGRYTGTSYTVATEEFPNS